MDRLTPQNPYISCIVQASAGSGKTYQLSRRFLNLVAAGAEPSKILTITFTKKAAQEMRGRIIKEASELLKSPKRSAEFEKEISYLWQEEQKTSSQKIECPKSAEQTAMEILSQTQSLKISTIDSLFNEWVNRFTYEAGSGNFPFPFTLQAQEDLEPTRAMTWSKLFSFLTRSNLDLRESELQIRNTLELAIDILASESPELKVSTIKKVAEDLITNESIIWNAKLSGSPILEYPEPKSGLGTEEDVIQFLKPELKVLVEKASNPNNHIGILEETSLEGLTKHKLITKDYKVSGSTYRGKRRDTVEAEILKVEETLVEICNKLAIEKLKTASQGFFSIFSLWQTINNQIKQSNGELDFSDITKGAFNLLSDEACQGAFWMIQNNINHILLDEFQDTSLLQWGIFKKLSEEIISKYDERLGFPYTAFIVGDVKQSIYGFRQADPTVMSNAAEFLLSKDHHAIPMNKSFRTANIVLNYVNEVFQQIEGESFPLHSTAEVGGKPFIPDVGKVIIFNSFEAVETEDNQTIKSVENEAERISDFIENALSNPEKFPVHENGGFRPLKASDIAILYKNKTKSELFEKSLRKRGIASIKEEQNGFFDRQEILDMMAILNFIAYPSDICSFLTILKSPVLNVSDKELVDFTANIKNMETGDSLCSFAAAQLAPYQDRITLLEQITQPIKYKSIKDIFFEINSELGISSSYKSLYKGKEGNVAENNILKFILLMSDFDKDGIKTPKQILKKLKKLATTDTEGNAASNDDAVKMMTIHKSKGLEFAMVFVIETAQKWYKNNIYWEPLKDDQGETKMCFLGYTDSKKYPSYEVENRKERIIKNLKEEAARVLYVALTRSSQYLILSGNTKSKERDFEEGSFFSELLQSAIKLGAVEDSEGMYELSTAGISTIEEHKLADSKYSPSFSEAESGKDFDLVAPHAASKTEGLETQISIPQLAGPPSEHAASLGLFFHRLMELSIMENQFISEEAIEFVKSEFFRSDELDSLSNWITQYLNDAKTCFNGTLNPILKDAKNIWPEVKIASREDEQIVKGICDLVIEYEDKVLIIDHKTTGPKDPNTAKDFCVQKGYDKQLEVYKKSINGIFKSKKIETAVLLSRTFELVSLDN